MLTVGSWLDIVILGLWQLLDDWAITCLVCHRLALGCILMVLSPNGQQYVLFYVVSEDLCFLCNIMLVLLCYYAMQVDNRPV